MGQPYEEKLNVQRIKLDNAYSGMAEAKEAHQNWVPANQELRTETRQETKPDYVDQAYVFFRSVMPGWMFILSVPIGAISILITIMVFKRWVDKCLESLWRKK